MAPTILAGAAYFASVFAAGVILGAIRILFVIPAIGELAGVLTELPLLLVWSWIVCGWLLRRFAIPAGTSARFVMGGTGFALLMAAEVSLWVFAEGRSVHAFLSQYREAPALAGLLGQIAFALIPLRR